MAFSAAEEGFQEQSVARHCTVSAPSALAYRLRPLAGIWLVAATRIRCLGQVLVLKDASTSRKLSLLYCYADILRYLILWFEALSSARHVRASGRKYGMLIVEAFKWTFQS